MAPCARRSDESGIKRAAAAAINQHNRVAINNGEKQQHLLGSVSASAYAQHRRRHRMAARRNRRLRLGVINGGGGMAASYRGVQRRIALINRRMAMAAGNNGSIKRYGSSGVAY